MQSTVASRLYPVADHDLLNLHGLGDRKYVLRVKDLPDNQKPREKLQQRGPRNLSLAELVAIVWGVGTKKEELLNMAQRLTKEYGNHVFIATTNPSQLADALDIPIGKACQIIAGLELGRRFYARQGGKATYVRNARQAFQYFKNMGQSKKEQLRGIYLNSRYQVIHDELISMGTLTSSVVHPREVFQPALEHGAIAIIIAHNHPSENLEPTNSDIVMTEQLLQAGKILGIELLDHLVIIPKKYISVLECIHHDLQDEVS